MKYYEHGKAMRELQDFFLLRSEYSHLAILPDDLVVEDWQINQLWRDVHYRDPAVIGGCCLCNNGEQPDDALNISLTHVTNPDRTKRKYELLTLAQREDLLRRRCDIVITKWQGFPCTIIRRDVLERVELRVDGYYNNFEGGCCADNCFNWQLAEQGITAYSDLRVLMKHLAKARELNFGVGVKKPYTRLERVDS